MRSVRLKVLMRGTGTEMLGNGMTRPYSHSRSGSFEGGGAAVVRSLSKLGCCCVAGDDAGAAATHMAKAMINSSTTPSNEAISRQTERGREREKGG